MSTIDQYKHKLIGEIECPSDYDLVFRNSTRILPVYQLEQDIPSDETDFDGKAGDLLVGGGSGEAQALRISHPEAMKAFLEGRRNDPGRFKGLYKDFWSPTFAYKLGTGFRKLGWSPEILLEQWVAEKVVRSLLAAGTIG